MKTKGLLFIVIVLIFSISCNDTKSDSKKVPADLKIQIEQSYPRKMSTHNESAESIDVKGIFKSKPKLSKVKEPTKQDSVKLPNWIINKKYISENADAIKNNPALLIGALARTYDDGRFDIFPVTYNVRLESDLLVLSKNDKPTNFYEQTYDNNTRFNADFIIGDISIGNEEIVKVTYSETNYGNLEKYDETKLSNLRNTILNINGANLKDWSIVRGVVVLDCTSTKNMKTEANAKLNASWISSGGSFYKQTGNTDNFRLISIDLESLFLLP